LSGCSHFDVNNTVTKYPDAIGISDLNCSYGNYAGNYIVGSNHLGLRTEGSDNGIIDGNEVYDIALFDNLGLSGIGAWYNGNGIATNGDNNTISNNRINEVGYNGISFNKINTVEYNYVTNFCRTKNDGGGVYTSAAVDYQNEANLGSIVRYNICLYGWGVTTNGTAYAEGIYLDESSGGITVEYNTIGYQSGRGIFLHDGNGHTVRYNTIFNCENGLYMSKDGRNVIMSNNIVYGILNQELTHLNAVTGSPTINNNTYINHYTASCFQLNFGTHYTFTNWKSTTAHDASSTFDGSALGVGETEELFYNPTKEEKVFYLGGDVYRDITGTQVTGTFTLQPFTSRILIKTTGNTGDVTKPVVTAFVIPATSNLLTVAISTFTATDAVGVTGYKVTESSTAPTARATGWTSTAPTSYTFVAEGTKTLYAWAKDADGNVSLSANDGVVITFLKIGNQTVYGTNSSTTNMRRAYPVTMTESGKIVSIVVYHGTASSGNEILVGVYSDKYDKPRNRLGLSVRTQLTLTEGWQEIYLTTPVTVTAGQKIWLTWQMETAVNMKYVAGSETRATRTVTFPSMPSTFGTASYSNYSYSVYAKYSR
jgi:parallel beta-helix repeat protein